METTRSIQAARRVYCWKEEPVSHSHQTKGNLEDVSLGREVHEAIQDTTRPPSAVFEETFLLAIVTEPRHDCGLDRDTGQEETGRDDKAPVRNTLRETTERMKDGVEM